jgi:energy-coupling factor transport system permease protein
VDKDTLSGYHPTVAMLFFVLVIGSTMFIQHPVLLAMSFLGSLSYSIYLNGRKAIRFNLMYMMPLLLIAMLLNPAFSHQGVTILTYLPSGNPLTLESIVYGVHAAFMLITVITWFSGFNKVMTSDKFVYLFGRIIPAMSLVLSMALRFVPRFTAQIKIIANAQRCVGRDVSNGGVLQRAKHGIKILSMLVTWSLENAIDTADSMKSRGYGLPKRSAFSIFRFDKRDRWAMLFLLIAGGLLISGSLTSQLLFWYYPVLTSAPLTVFQVIVFISYLALSLMPMLLNLKVDLTWRTLQASASKV